MKKIITAVAVLTFGATLAMAAPFEGDGGQGGHHRHHRAYAEKFAQKLNLSDAQKQQIRDIHKSFHAENQAFFDSFRQNWRDFRAAKQAGDTAKAEAIKATLQSQHEQLKQLRAGLDEKIGAVLTPDQLQQWNTMKAERAARHQHRQQS